MPEKNCSYTLVFVGSCLLLVWPLYAYCLYKWHQHRSHFGTLLLVFIRVPNVHHETTSLVVNLSCFSVIKNRWPVLSISVVALVFLVQVMTLVESVMCVQLLSPISVGFSNIINGLVFYRAHLLVQRYLASQHHLSAMGREAHARGVNINKAGITINLRFIRFPCFWWKRESLLFDIDRSLYTNPP